MTESQITNQNVSQYFDFIVAFCGLILLLPLLLFCAFLVKLSSKGEIFFVQNRVGHQGKIFKLYKFRTMYVSNKGLPFTASNDVRITPIGKFLRHWKLDEFPQFINIIKGEMALVGPRPEVPELVDLRNSDWKEILSVKPGLTDPVTISLRNEEQILEQVEDKEHYYRSVIQPYKINGYLTYVRSKNVKFDLSIIIQTLKIVIFSK